jgi:hypothetical protein
MNEQLHLFEQGSSDFLKFHQAKPEIFRAFEKLTLETIGRGFQHYSAKGILELVRWHTGVRDSEEFKVNNNYTPLYARAFAKKHPNHRTFFRTRESKFDV